MIRHIHAHEQIFTASVESNVMLPAEPPDLKGRGVVVMMRVCSGMSADLASLSDQLAALEPALHREMGTVLCSILLAPIGLPRACCQLRFSNDRPLP